MWIERYEKEQKEHAKTQGDLLQVKGELKDQILNVKTGEIKLLTAAK